MRTVFVLCFLALLVVGALFATALVKRLLRKIKNIIPKKKDHMAGLLACTVVLFVVCMVVAPHVPSAAVPTEPEAAASATQAAHTIAQNETPAEKIASQEAAFSAPAASMEPIEPIDSVITSTLTQAGYTLEHASKIQEILNTVGVTGIFIENATGEAETGLNAVVCYPNGYTDRDRRFYFTTEDGVIFYAGFLGEDLYDSEKGGFLKSYEDVHVPEKEITIEVYESLRSLSEEAVEECLNYPNTANFGMLDWGIGRSDEKYQVVGKVTAKNGFGVKEEMGFSVWFISSGGVYSVEGVSLDGVRVK